MSIRQYSRTHGHVHHLPDLNVLSDIPCNLLYVSDRTLSVLQNLSLLDVTFHSRYSVEIISPTSYRAPLFGSMEWDDATRIAENVGLELIPLALEDELTRIALAIENLQLTSGCCPGGESGTIYDPPPNTAGPTIGAGQDFPDLPTYEDYKCRAANWIVDSQIAVADRLSGWNIDELSVLSAGALVGLIVAVLVTSFFGRVLSAVLGAVSALVGAIAGTQAFSFTDIITELTAVHSDLVCALYEGITAEAARDNYLTVLDGTSLNAAEKLFIQLTLANNILNKLFENWTEPAAHPVTSSCAGCGPAWCGVNWHNPDGQGARGSGTIAVDGTPHAFTSFAHPNGFHYFSFSVNDGQFGFNGDCDGLSGTCNPQHVIFKFTAPLVGFTTSSYRIQKCSGATLTDELVSPTGIGVGEEFDWTWGEFISTTSFSGEFQLDFP